MLDGEFARNGHCDRVKVAPLQRPGKEISWLRSQREAPARPYVICDTWEDGQYVLGTKRTDLK